MAPLNHEYREFHVQIQLRLVKKKTFSYLNDLEM